MFMLKGCVIIPEHLLPQGGSEPPTNFSITTPINGQTIQDNTVQIQWSESTDPDNTNISYILYLWKSDSNGEYLIVDYRENIIIREETLSDLENGNYKIKIVAIDDDDHTSHIFICCAEPRFARLHASRAKSVLPPLPCWPACHAAALPGR